LNKRKLRVSTDYFDPFQLCETAGCSFSPWSVSTSASKQYSTCSLLATVAAAAIVGQQSVASRSLAGSTALGGVRQERQHAVSASTVAALAALSTRMEAVTPNGVAGVGQ
jgi:hypothetical protein